jgi:hypothetical protein
VAGALLAAAICVVLLLGLAPAVLAGTRAPRDAAARSASPSLTLVSQSWWVTPGQRFALQAALGPGSPPLGQLDVKLTLYNRLTARSTFTATLSGTPTGGVLDETGPVAATAAAGTTPTTAPATGPSTTTAPSTTTPAATFSLSVGIDDATSSPTAAPSLQLGCSPGACQGVYPLEVTVEQVGNLQRVAHLLTYLTYDEDDLTSAAQAAGPGALRVALVVPVTVPVAVRGGTGPAGALPAPSHREVATAAGTVAALTRADLPVTVATTGRSVQALAGQGGHAGTAARAQLAALAASPTAQVPTSPYVPIDPGWLADDNLSGEVAAQLGSGAAVLAHQGVHDENGTWVVPPGGPAVGTALGRGLDLVAAAEHTTGARLEVVVPEDQLAPPPQGSDQATFSQPFSLQIADANYRAAVADRGLTAHFTADPGDPALAASQFLADLAFIHDERPSLSDPRGVVAVPPEGWTARPVLVADILAGLEANPLVEPVTVNQFFAEVPVGRNGDSPTRRPVVGGAGATPHPAVADVVALSRQHLAAFDSAADAPVVRTQLDDILLASETDRFGPAGQLGGLHDFGLALQDQLDQISLAYERSITLTARNAPIPVTVLSSAPYTMHVVLTVSSDKLEFPPPGGTRRLTLDHPSEPVRVAAVARTSGDLPVNIRLTTPQYGLVIEQDEITVRSTATSAVGVALTLGAIAVLLLWWARTWRRGRRDRHRGAPAHPAP